MSPSFSPKGPGDLPNGERTEHQFPLKFSVAIQNPLSLAEKKPAGEVLTVEWLRHQFTSTFFGKILPRLVGKAPENVVKATIGTSFSAVLSPSDARNLKTDFRFHFHALTDTAVTAAHVVNQHREQIAHAVVTTLLQQLEGLYEENLPEGNPFAMERALEEAAMPQ